LLSNITVILCFSTLESICIIYNFHEPPNEILWKKHWFESILFQRMFNHVRSIITEFQHGFVKGRSTVTNLTLITDFIARTLDRGGQVDVMYTGFFPRPLIRDCI